MSADLLRMVQDIEDRQDIYDCLMRYCRGIDRLDRAMLLSAYHSDALDDHGSFVGGVDAFADHVFALHSTHQHRTQHHITNHSCALDGETANCESYYIFRSLNKQAPLHTTASGRYLDRLEKRDGRWAIAARICLVDIRNDFWSPTGFEGEDVYERIARDSSDTSYRLPVQVEQARRTDTRG
jgi:hypothetical protein